MQNICLHPAPLCLVCQNVLPEEIQGEVVWEICCICFSRGVVLEKEPTGQPNGLNEHPAQERDLLFASPQLLMVFSE